MPPKVDGVIAHCRAGSSRTAVKARAMSGGKIRLLAIGVVSILSGGAGAADAGIAAATRPAAAAAALALPFERFAAAERDEQFAQGLRRRHQAGSVDNLPDEIACCGNLCVVRSRSAELGQIREDVGVEPDPDHPYRSSRDQSPAWRIGKPPAKSSSASIARLSCAQ